MTLRARALHRLLGSAGLIAGFDVTPRAAPAISAARGFFAQRLPATVILLLPASLRRRPTTLTVRFATTAMHLRSRRILLRMRRGLRGTPRGRLATATTGLVRGGLGRPTRSRALLRHVVHLVALIDARLHTAGRAAAASTRRCRAIVVGDRYVRLLIVAAAASTTRAGPTASAPAGKATCATRPGSSARTAATDPARATSARSAAVATMNLRATSPWRPVTPISHMIRSAVASSSRAAAVTAARSAVRAVNVGPASRPTVVRAMRVRRASGATVIVATAPVRPMSRTAVVTTTVVGRTSSCSHHTATREHPRALGSSNTWLTAVHRRAQIMIAERAVLVLSLQVCEAHMMVMLRSQLMRVRSRMQTTIATIEAHTSHVDVVDDRPVIDVGDMNATEVRDGPVVVERMTTPVAALKTNTAVSVAVVDTTVEPYVRSPITFVPRVHAATPTPIAGRPQQTGGGSQYPRTRHPVIVVVTVRPITRCPDVANRGAGWLYIHRQGRRCDGDGDAD